MSIYTSTLRTAHIFQTVVGKSRQRWRGGLNASCDDKARDRKSSDTGQGRREGEDYWLGILKRIRCGKVQTHTHLHLIICSLMVAASHQYPPPPLSSYIPPLGIIPLLLHATPQALSPRFYSHSSCISDLEDCTISQGCVDDG